MSFNEGQIDRESLAKIINSQILLFFLKEVRFYLSPDRILDYYDHKSVPESLI